MSLSINADKNLMEIEVYSQYVHQDFLSELKFPLTDFLEALDKASAVLKDF